MDAKSALELIREVSVRRLGGFDGCLCSNFEVQGICVDISCRKSSGSSFNDDFHGTVVRVHSRHLDSDAELLQPIAREVAEQIRGYDGCAIKVRFCDYEQDSKQQCVYCGKSREDPVGYLCNSCMIRTDHGNVAEQHDARRFEFLVEEAT